MKTFSSTLRATALLVALSAPQIARAQEEIPPNAFNSPDAAEVAAPVNDYKIEPGVRAGALLLGMNSRAVLALMGKPSELFPRSAGIEEIVWRGAKDTETRVILGADAVIQINVNDSRYRDPLGNGVSSPLKTIFARYRAKGYAQPKQFVFNIEEPGGGGYEANIYDDREAGIAYHLGVQDVFDLGSPPDTLIVHRAGKAALPARGATPVSLEERAAREKSLNARAPALPPAPRVSAVTRAWGNGLPLTEIVVEGGARGWVTKPVILPGRVFVSANALTSIPDNRLWHPLVHLTITASQDRAVWQDVSGITFSWGYRRLALATSKETVADNSGDVPLTSTVLRVRFPFRDFLDMARAGKFVVSIGDASFPVERNQTLGIRALARICGASDIDLDGGSSSPSRSTSKPAAPISNRAPVGGANEFFPQTRRRALSRSEVRALSAGDLRLAINEIYARHGLGFKDKALQSRFEALGWYRARDERTIAVIESRLSRIERSNLDLLVAERKRR